MLLMSWNVFMTARMERIPPTLVPGTPILGTAAAE
jgi:hypothetical protein